ncbi:hypothetical protein Scep_001288 [Stephania cephalantha]|uniref:Uncharacterized protein n=1 Tax=Stephania cephalantha TaxID=152367 RepID=A0AAP0L950_9MAGN
MITCSSLDGCHCILKSTNLESYNHNKSRFRRIHQYKALVWQHDFKACCGREKKKITIQLKKTTAFDKYKHVFHVIHDDSSKDRSFLYVNC